MQNFLLAFRFSQILNKINLGILSLLFWFQRQKSGLVVSKLDSQLEGCGFESHPILDGNGVKAMPGLII